MSFSNLQILSHGSEKSPIFTEPSSSEQGSIRAASASVPLATADSLFGQLLNRLEDPYAPVRRIAANGLGDIGTSVGFRKSSGSRSLQSRVSFLLAVFGI